MTPARGITAAMYDRYGANPTATTLIVTRLEWELLTNAIGHDPTPIMEAKATLLGKPVVILEDKEMSW